MEGAVQVISKEVKGCMLLDPVPEMPVGALGPVCVCVWWGGACKYIRDLTSTCNTKLKAENHYRHTNNLYLRC